MSLLHLTGSQSALRSICENGLLFTYNPTEVLCSLLGQGPQIVESFDTGGMICFTELSYKEAKHLFECSYGVSVDKDWAIERGARKVDYINVDTDKRISDLRSFLVRNLANKFPEEIKSDPNLNRWLTELAITKKEFSISLGAAPELLGLIEAALWFQKDSYSVEKEWRIRSFKGYPDQTSSRMNRQEKIDHLLRLGKIKGVAPLVLLNLEPSAIISFYTPAGIENSFRNYLNTTKFAGCPVNI
jgi:hypothetical protein